MTNLQPCNIISDAEMSLGICDFRGRNPISFEQALEDLYIIQRAQEIADYNEMA